MKYLLDTNVCIRLLKGSSSSISNRIKSIDNDQIIVPSIVRFELYYGAFKSNRQEATLNTLQSFFDCFKSLPFDDDTSKICGKIRATLDRKGTPIGPYDLIIASMAIQHDLILITHNTKEFSRIEGLKFDDWEV